MKKLFIGIGILIAILLAALFIVPSLIPSSVYKDKIQSQLSTELGREVRIPGEVKLSTFPVIKARTGAIEIDNPAGFSRTDFATLEGLDARIKLLPLLSKRVEISRFTLREPQIYLERRADGVANWEIADTSAEPKPDTGPFKRDGRMAGLDPQISAFNLENGTVSYIDATTDTRINVTDINSFISLPSMAKALIVDGSLTYNDMPLTLDISLDSPRAFLDGQSANIKGTAKTDFADVKIDGAFLPGEAIAMAAKLDASVTDMAALKPFAGDQAQYLDPLSTAKFNGNIRYDETAITADEAVISVTGDKLNLNFKGDAGLKGETPTATGKLDGNISDLSVLKPYLPDNVTGLNQIKAVDFKADLSALNQGFSAKNLSVNASGPALTANYKGEASYSNNITTNGNFDVDISSPASLAAIFAPDVKGADALGPTQATGRLNFDGENIRIQTLSAKTNGPNLSGNFDGDVSVVNEVVSATGNFTAKAPDLPALATLADMKIENIAAVKAASASGQINYTADKITLSSVDAKLTDGALNGTYKGNTTLGDTPAFDGTFTANIPSLSNLDKAVTKEIPYANAVGQIIVDGTVKGAGQSINIPVLSATLTDGLITGSYKGSATYSDGLTLNGALDSTISSLRELAQMGGTTLPPSTDRGAIFTQMKLGGQISGTPEKIDLKNAKLSVDDISGTGTFGVTLTGAKPYVTGNLALTGLDLRPYMESYSAQRPEGSIQPWSEAPMNVSALRAVDGEFQISSPNLVTDRLSVNNVVINSTLENGFFEAKIPQLKLYGGLGNMTAQFDATTDTPSFSLDAKLNELQTNKFLTAIAGFANATGDGNTILSVKGRGASQAALMRSLNGNGGVSVKDGSLQGIDLSEFLTGLDQALTARQLPGGIGAAEVTKFQNIVAGFEIENGVVKIADFNLSGLNIMAEGGGQIDLGNQTIDFRLRPKVTGEQAKGLAAFGIPIRFQGNFGSAKAGLDSQFLGEIIEAKAKAELQNRVRDQIGGPVGNILGGVLGGGNSNGQTPGNDTSTNTEPTPAPQEPSVENILGGLIPNDPKTQEAPEPKTDATAETDAEKKTTEEELVEDALRSIFGKKKPKKDE